MSDTDLDPAADGIEVGKRLVRIGGNSGVSLADRIAERLYRFTWRTPLHNMRLKGRHPLKLIAVADDPFFGNVERGHALLDGIIYYRGEERSIASLDFRNPDWSSGFDEYLHSFAWLRDLSSVTVRVVAAPVAEAITAKWLAVHGEKVSEPAWRADLCGRRILFWTAHAPLILSASDLVYRSSVLHALARGARHLESMAERAPLGVPHIAAWAGVLAAGLMVPGGDPRRALAETGLTRALASSVYSDGGVVSRAPAAQMEAIQLLTMLRSCYEARRLDAPEFLQTALTRMVSALLGICHGDKGLASWQGGTPVSATQLGEFIEATGVRTRPLKQATEWGYQRLSHGSTILMLDGAPPPLSRLSNSGCASTLAFEMSDGADRIVVNCGGAGRAGSRIPSALAEALRTTAAHSTLTLNNVNSTAIEPGGPLGRGVTEVEFARQESDSGSRVEASHNGYIRRSGFRHRRVITLGGDGRDVRGEDMLLPEGRRRIKTTAPFAVRFHLHPKIQISPTADGLGALLRTGSGQLWQFRCKGGTLAVEDSLWVDSEGQPIPSQQLVINGATAPGGETVSWVFHRAK